MTDEEERELRRELMQADIDLKRKQGAWETPRNIAILAGTIAAFAAAVAGVLGYKIGSQPPQTINVHLDAPIVGKQ
jgi:hypothetical protein